MSTVVKTRSYEGNAEAIEAWNGVLFDKFVRFRHILCGGLAIVGTTALDRHPPMPGSRVLDVGCGFGDSTCDIAARFIETAAAEAAAANVSNARFAVADAESDALGGPYDYVFSRFGTMFFANPVAALRNLRRELAPGGRLVMTVWRKKEDNPWLHDAERAVAPIVPLPPSTDEPTCGPGPFSMTSADVVSAQLLAAGFRDVVFERFDTPIQIGDSVRDAVNFAMALGPAGEMIRLAGAEGERRRPQVAVALEELLTPLARSTGVFAGASTWIVVAR